MLSFLYTLFIEWVACIHSFTFAVARLNAISSKVKSFLLRKSTFIYSFGWDAICIHLFTVKTPQKFLYTLKYKSLLHRLDSYIELCAFLSLDSDFVMHRVRFQGTFTSCVLSWQLLIRQFSTAIKFITITLNKTIEKFIKNECLFDDSMSYWDSQRYFAFCVRWWWWWWILAWKWFQYNQFVWFTGFEGCETNKIAV